MSATPEMSHLLDRARDSERGIVLRTETPGKAVNLAQRLAKFRRTERAENRKIYPPDHPSFGRTSWDTLRILAPKGECKVIIDKHGSDVLAIEEL
jgi:hypothetical protein